jgi:branched-chain amino acid transport system permease protein
MLEQIIINGIVMGCYYVLIAVGLSIIYGVLGISHFAHGSVAMLGGYICYLFVMRAGFDFIPAVLISCALSALVGIAIERFGYRPLRTHGAPQINVFIVALGIGMIIDNVTQLIFGPDQVRVPTSYNDVIAIGDVKIAGMRFWLIIATFLLIALFSLYLKKTKMGKAIRATSENMTASTMMGVNTNVVIAIVFAVGSLMGAIAGSFMGSLFAIYPAMGNATVMKGFAVLILGGLGSTKGIVIGGLIIGLAESFGAMYISSDFKEIYAFIIMIVVLMFRPNGLFGSREGH